MKIRPLRAKVFMRMYRRTDRYTDRYDEASSRFSQFS